MFNLIIRSAFHWATATSHSCVGKLHRGYVRAISLNIFCMLLLSLSLLTPVLAKSSHDVFSHPQSPAALATVDDIDGRAVINQDSASQLTPAAARDVLSGFARGELANAINAIASRFSPSSLQPLGAPPAQLTVAGTGSRAGFGDIRIWGIGHQNQFQGDNADTFYDGDIKIAHLGITRPYTDHLRGGLMISKSEGDSDVENRSGGDARTVGNLQTDVTSLYTYVRWVPGSATEVWGALGIGDGDIAFVPDGEPLIGTGMSMYTAIAGLRRDLELQSGVDIALRGDLGLIRYESDAAGEEAIHDLKMDVLRGRLGLELWSSRQLDSGAVFTPFALLSARYDDGDADAARSSGLEIEGGFRYAGNDRLGLEIWGRKLTAHNNANYTESGVAVVVAMRPRADGQGLSLSLSPRWGEVGAGTVMDGVGGGDSDAAAWGDDSALQTAATTPSTAASDDWHMQARFNYGVGIPAWRALLTSFAELEVPAGGRQYAVQRTRLGMRLGFNDGDLQGLDVELTGEQRDTDNHQDGYAKHRLEFTARLHF